MLSMPRRRRHSMSSAAALAVGPAVHHGAIEAGFVPRD
jgi:hypothetical protein